MSAFPFSLFGAGALPQWLTHSHHCLTWFFFIYFFTCFYWPLHACNKHTLHAISVSLSNKTLMFRFCVFCFMKLRKKNETFSFLLGDLWHLLFIYVHFLAAYSSAEQIDFPSGKTIHGLSEPWVDGFYSLVTHLIPFHGNVWTKWWTRWQSTHNT